VLQKQAENNLLLEKDKLTNIFKAMTDGVYRASLKSFITDFHI